MGSTKYSISLVPRPCMGPGNEVSTISPQKKNIDPTSLNHLLHLSFCSHNSGYTLTLAYRIGYFRQSLVHRKFITLLTLGACAVGRSVCVCVCVCVTVCLSVTTLAATYSVYTSPVKFYRVFFLWRFQDFSRVAFAENASFKSCGVIF